MTTTTLMGSHVPIHKNAVLQDLLLTASYLFGKTFCAEDIVCNVTKRWFGPDQIHYYTNLYVQVDDCGQYQVMSCVKDHATALAYMYGLLAYK